MNEGDRSERDRARREVEEFLAHPDGDRAGQATSASLLESLAARVTAIAQQTGANLESVGPYRIGRLLGEGGMGVVFLGRHERTGAQAAVKIVDAADQKLAKMLREEARALGAVQSPHVVRVIDEGTDGRHAWVATDYVPGQDLRAWLGQERVRRRPGLSALPRYRPLILPVNSAARLELLVGWFRDLSRALADLHGQQFIHRDVKPANIVISRGGFPYLIDFGLVQVEGLNVPGVLAGTIPYMSPEQVMGGYLALRPTSDLYSLAVTFHEALAGARLVDGERGQALHAVAFADIPRISEVNRTVPESLDPIFTRALERDPERRYPDGLELAAELDAWLRAGKAKKRPRGRAWRLTVSGMSSAVLGLLLWTVGTVYAARAEQERVCDTISGLLREGSLTAHDRATEIAVGAMRRHHDSEPFRRTVEHLVARVGPERTRRLLVSQAFTVQGFGLSLSQRFANEAQELARLVSDEHLVFHRAFDRLMRGHPREAAQILETADTQLRDSRLLHETAATARAVAGLAPPESRTVRREVGTDPSSILCLRAIRCLWRVPGGGRGDRRLGSPSEVRQLVDEIERELRSPDGGGHRLLRTLRVRALIELGDWGAASAEILNRLKDPALDDERAALLVLMCAVRVAESGDRQVDPVLVAELSEDTRRACAMFEGSAAAIARELAVLVAESRASWIWAAASVRSLGGLLDSLDLRQSDEFSELLARIADRSMNDDPRQLLELLDAIGTLKTRGAGTVLVANANELRGAMAWASYRTALISAESGQSRDAQALLRRTRDITALGWTPRPDAAIEPELLALMAEVETERLEDVGPSEIRIHELRRRMAALVDRQHSDNNLADYSAWLDDLADRLDKLKH